MSGKLQKLEVAVVYRLRTTSESAVAAFSNTQGGAVDIVAALDAAQHIQDLRELFDLPQVRDRIVALQDTPIGFRTDRDPKVKKKGSEEYNTPYNYAIVRDCAIEATLRGLQLVGNQWNIISGRCYVTKEGFEVLIRKVKGLADFAPMLGVPKSMNGGALVDCFAAWTLNGKHAECKATIPVRTDAYSSADQTLGKAARKFLKRCYEQMTGVSVPEGEEEGGDVQVPEAPKIAFKAPVKAEAEPIHLVPAEPQPTPPAQPADPPADPGPDALSETQTALAAFVSGAGYDWEVFQTAIINTNMFKGADAWTGYADVSEADCKRIIGSQVGMKRAMANVAANGK